ncbi:cupin domain-containing protein [Novosphingobium sp. PS1R-30]|uniref:Cupin domain-containing protein n=1 Tax=Novosphingobium anseongense TaxID=3133436 RepID=A0ABU8S2D6_9SPHN
MSDEAATVSVMEIKAITGKAEKSTRMKPFRYKAPENPKRDRALVPLVKTQTLLSMVQVFRGGGGEQELHMHTAMDGFWFVLSGRARFYGEGDELVADLGPHEGVLVPAGAKYWFEAGDCEQLELLQVESIDHRLKNEVVYYADRTRSVVEVYEPDGTIIAPGVRLGGG